MLNNESRWMLTAVLAMSMGACAGPKPAAAPTAEPSLAPEPAVVSETEQPAAEPAEVEEQSKELPTACAAADKDVCTPPAAFVARLCRTRTPDVALTMFRKGTPWTRAYVRRNMEAWYASGSRSSPKQLRYAEEVLIVADRSSTSSGMQVSGAGSFDVYRWDGTCVSLMSDEVSMRRPSTPDVATIPWKRLDSDIKKVLGDDRKISFRNSKRLEACKPSAPMRRCERANTGLSRMIAEYVRKGGVVPGPKLIP